MAIESVAMVPFIKTFSMFNDLLLYSLWIIISPEECLVTRLSRTLCVMRPLTLYGKEGFHEWVKWILKRECRTIRCRYNAVSFPQITHNRHPIARPWGRGTGWLLWVQAVINVLPRSLQWCMRYCAILHRVITALHCNLNDSVVTAWLWSCHFENFRCGRK